VQEAERVTYENFRRLGGETAVRDRVRQAKRAAAGDKDPEAAQEQEGQSGPLQFAPH
jgi:hypothetical protein